MEDIDELERRIREHVETQDKLMESTLKMWIMSAVVLQIIPLVTIAFFIGGIYQTLNSSITLLQTQQQQLSANSQWMQERRQWELSVELWGAQQEPPLRTPSAMRGPAPADR
jgi:hypothetical protein